MTAADTSEPAPARPVRKRNRRPKYSAEPTVTVPDEDTLGPAMLACTPIQRRFVLELARGPAGYGSELRACRAAGYGRPGSTDLYLRVQAHQLLHSDRIQAALREVGGKMIRAAAFTSIRNTEAIANNPAHRDCLRANLALLDRAFPVETTHHVKVERSPESILIVTEATIERIRQLAIRAGLDADRQVAAVKQIEGVATHVEDAT